MARGALARPFERLFLFRSLRALYRHRLTGRGRFLLWTAAALAFLGMDTRHALVFILFSLAAPPLLVGLPLLFRRAPGGRVRGGGLPGRLTAGRTALVTIEVGSPDGRETGALSLAFDGPLPADSGLRVEPPEALFTVERSQPGRVRLTLRPQRRGRYVLPALGIAWTDAFGLLRSRGVWLPEQIVLAYPRYFTLDELPLPLGRRYQPGGIPLASEVGDSLEFVGTREYREGDPLRKIHWRSWGRLGRPVVKEYQEEYFSRIALVLDTFLPRRPTPHDRDRFEAAISVLASVAEHFSRSDEVVDILAAGPDLYEVSTGRSLGYLDNVLDVLACLEPCPAPPFETIAPSLFERLERLTTVVAVLLDWDEAREAFLRRVRALGVAVHVLLVHEGDTKKPWGSVASDLGSVMLLPPSQVASRLAAEEEAR
jgi:uncharacterized protein (DUF58 family)